MDGEAGQELREAHRLWRAGRIHDAITAFEALLAHQPGLGDEWYNLGYLQRRTRAFEAALASYETALARGARDPEEIRLNRAAILADHLARPEEARAELEAALAANPRFVPAWLNLGNLEEDEGRRAPARKAYERALEIDPGNQLALARLAGLSDAEGPDDGMAQRLEAAIAASADPQDRADLGFALGRLRDAGGEHEAAFAAYAAANAAAARAQGLRYDRAAAELQVEAIMRAFDQPDPAEAAEDRTPAPLFIAGLFRSGSTLAERILAAHSRVQAGGELDLLPAAIEAHLPYYPEGAGDHARIAAIREAYLRGLPAHPPGTLLTDKRPDNFLHVGLIKRLFPAARIVHTVRDARDNRLSLYFLQLGPAMPYAAELGDIAHWQGLHGRLMAHWKSLYPSDIFELDYDALVADPKPVLRALLGFLGLDWEDGLLAFHRAASVVKTASVWQVRAPLYRRSSGRWRNYARQLGEPS